MKNDIKLFNELMAFLEIEDTDDIKKLQSILNNYNINDLNQNIKTLSQCIKEFCNYKATTGVAATTLTYYTTRLKDVLAFFGDVNPRDITKEDISNYLADIQNKPNINQNTRFQIVGVLKNFMGWMEAEGHITSNHTKTIKYKKQTNTRYPLTSTEIEAIRKCNLTLLEQLVFELLLCTGCRVSEVINIQLNDIDFTNNTIKVTGKGNKSRLVMFTDDVKTLLNQYKATCSDGVHAICVLSRGQVRPITKNRISAALKSIQDKAQLTSSLYCHRMRHTFASQSLEKGMDLVSIQTLMGHENLSTTQVYAKQNLESVKNNYKKVFNE